MTDYRNYKADDLMRDDDFIHSVKMPDTESDTFRKSIQQAGAIDVEEYHLAKSIILSLIEDRKKMSEEEKERLYRKIEAATVRPLRIRKRLFYCSAAASILLLLSVGLYAIFNRGENKEDAILAAVSCFSENASEHVELILSGEERIVIKEDNPAVDYAQKGKIRINETIIDARPDNTEKTAREKTQKEFNRLSVPCGKRSSLTLEDGTHVWINAGTNIVYPVSFDDKRREIYVEGEIYLDVAKDTKRPFTVRTPDMQIEVLGTSFNVTAYKCDHSSSVVLVSGSVKVNTGNRNYDLTPGNMLVKQDNSVNIKQVNALSHVSWIHGIYIFDNENIGNITMRLSRYYNVKINMDDESARLLCSGKLYLKDDVVDILNILQSTAPINYEMNEKGEYEILFNPLK